MDDLRRLRYVTERYEQLQGLRLVPLALPFLLSSVWREGRLAWVPWTHGVGVRIWFLALVALAIRLSLAARTYYRRRFGAVQPALSLRAPLAGSLFAALFSVAACLQHGVQPSVSGPLAVVALGLAYVGLVGGAARLHYLAVAAATALFAGLGPLGVPLHTRDVLFDQLIGIGFIVVGLGDHLLLRRTLAPVPCVDTL
jgi:hypothetical protein